MFKNNEQNMLRAKAIRMVVNIYSRSNDITFFSYKFNVITFNSLPLKKIAIF